MRRSIPPLLLCAACAGRTAALVSPPDQRLHCAALVVDAHAGTIEAMFSESHDLRARHRSGHLDLPRMQEGGLDAEFSPSSSTPESVELAHWKAFADRGADAARRREVAVSAG